MGSVLGPWSVGFAGSKIGEVKIGEVMAHGASAKRVKLMGSPWVSLPAGGRLKKTLFPPLVSQCPKNAHIRWQHFTPNAGAQDLRRRAESAVHRIVMSVLSDLLVSAPGFTNYRHHTNSSRRRCQTQSQKVPPHVGRRSRPVPRFSTNPQPGLLGCVSMLANFAACHNRFNIPRILGSPLAKRSQGLP